jgi:uncharacterized protein YxjI
MTTHVPLFYLRQKFSMTTNRYEVQAAEAEGRPGQTLALAQQKRLALKEEVIFYADESKTHRVFSFKARAVMDLNAGYDIFDEQGQQIGFFRKDFGASLLRSTFHIEGPGYTGRGQERSQAVALLRRFADIPFLPIHFDYEASDGQPLFSVERQGTVRDRYTVRVPDPRVDFRVAAAVAVAMDAMMGR